MDFFRILDLLGGVAFFLYGMHVMGRGLTRLAGNQLQILLEKLTASRKKALTLGLAVTLIIQSSAATIVMVIGLVNSQLMGLLQALYVSMGADIGTTITAWLLSLSSLSKGATSGASIITYFNPLSYLPLLAVVGVIFVVFIKNTKRYNIGSIMLGFVLIMYGMDVMKAAVKPLQDSEAFSQFMLRLNNPLLAIIFGVVITLIIQSSSASVGMLQAFAVTGLLDYRLAIPVILGCNIGTCGTALISSLSASVDGKRVAVSNLLFKTEGVVVIGSAFYLLIYFWPPAILDELAQPVGIAIFHTGFNVLNACLHYAFMPLLLRLVEKILPDYHANGADILNDKEILKALDARFLNTPAFAVQQTMTTTLAMGQYAKFAIEKAIALLEKYDENEYELVVKLENLTDKIEDALVKYTLKLSTHRMSDADNNHLTMVMQCLSYFEQIGDRALQIANAANEMHSKKMQFSKEAAAELKVLESAVLKILDETFVVFQTQNPEKAKQVEPLEEIVDYLERKIKNRHVKRLQCGVCTIELGFIMNDITSALERTSDHCSAIAMSTLEANLNEFGVHAFALELKEENPAKFKELYQKWRKTFSLPESSLANMKKM